MWDRSVLSPSKLRVIGNMFCIRSYTKVCVERLSRLIFDGWFGGVGRLKALHGLACIFQKYNERFGAVLSFFVGDIIFSCLGLLFGDSFNDYCCGRCLSCQLL